MGARKWRMIGLLVAGALVAAIGTAIAAQGDGEEDGAQEEVAVTAGDQELLDRLVDVLDGRPPLVPTEADLASNQLDPVLLGSFTSARSALDALEDDLRQLYIDGDDATTAVGDAVAAVTRGLLLEQQGLLVLEESDGSTNPRPLDASDARNDQGVAIDADGLLGLESIGIDLLIQARELQRRGYEVLDEVEGADPVFSQRLEELRTYEDVEGVTLRVVTSAFPDELLVPIQRFDAPIGVARATSATYACVDRFRYLELADLPPAERIAAAIEEPATQECVDIARRAGLSLEDQQAVAGTGGDDVDVDVDVDADAEDEVEIDIDVESDDET